MPPDDSKSEYLWKRIEERKQQGPSALPEAGTTPKNGTGPKEIPVLVNALFLALEAESENHPTQGQEAARLRLQQAIRAEWAPMPVVNGKWQSFRRVFWNRQALVVALLLLVIAIAACVMAYFSWQNTCHPDLVPTTAPTRPAALGIVPACKYQVDSPVRLMGSTSLHKMMGAAAQVEKTHSHCGRATAL